MKALRASFNALAFSLSVAGCKPDRDSLCGTAQVCSFDWESRAEVCWEASDCDHQNVAVKGATVASAIDFEPTFLDAGDGRIDLQIQVFGDQLGIDMPVSVRASGPDNAGLRHQCSKDLWIFHGIPISGLDRIEVSIPGTDIRAWKDLSGMDIEGSFSCDPRDSLLRKDLLPEFPERLSLGSEIEIRTPLYKPARATN